MGRKMAQQERIHLTLQSKAIKHTYKSQTKPSRACRYFILNHLSSLLEFCLEASSNEITICKFSLDFKSAAHLRTAVNLIDWVTLLASSSVTSGEMTQTVNYPAFRNSPCYREECGCLETTTSQSFQKILGRRAQDEAHTRALLRAARGMLK